MEESIRSYRVPPFVAERFGITDADVRRIAAEFLLDGQACFLRFLDRCRDFRAVLLDHGILLRALLRGQAEKMRPNCGDSEIIRCTHCRETLNIYKCVKCGKEGP